MIEFEDVQSFLKDKNINYSLMITIGLAPISFGVLFILNNIYEIKMKIMFYSIPILIFITGLIWLISSVSRYKERNSRSLSSALKQRQTVECMRCNKFSEIKLKKEDIEFSCVHCGNPIPIQYVNRNHSQVGFDPEIIECAKCHEENTVDHSIRPYKSKCSHCKTPVIFQRRKTKNFKEETLTCPRCGEKVSKPIVRGKTVIKCPNCNEKMKLIR